MENKEKPTLQAVKMKREQDGLLQHQIISLLDQKRIILDTLEQNRVDLEFVGYHPPMINVPKTYSETQWAELIRHRDELISENKMLTEAARSVSAINEKLERENASLMKAVKALRDAADRKCAKKTSKKK